MNSDVVCGAHPLSLHPLIVVWGGNISGFDSGVPMELMDFFSFPAKVEQSTHP
jgi:hypothetical protein